MKKYTLYIICFLMAVATTSCKKEKEEDSFLKGQMTDFQGQKAYIDGSNYSCFRRGEPILVNGRNNCTVSALSNSDRTCTISGAEESREGYYAFYPANLISATDISRGFSNATVTLPRVQQYAEEDGHQVIDNPMAGHLASSSGTIQFYNLCALLKVTLQSNWAKLDSIQVTMKGTDLWGTGSVDGTNWKIDMDNGATHDTKYETVSLVFPNGISIGNSVKAFYIMVPQNNISANNNAINVKFFGQYGQTLVNKNYSKNLENNKPLNHNTIITLNTNNFQPNVVGVGVFSVNDQGKKVAFAPGNLVKNLTTQEWHFPGKPYHNINTTKYFYCVTYSNDFSGDNDYGWINLIAGNPRHTWRTPTRDEWIFILTGDRGNNGSGEKNCVYTKVNGIKGLIIFPDNYSGTFPTKDDDMLETTWTNSYESKGCIFLPAHHSHSGTPSIISQNPQQQQHNNTLYDGYYAMANSYNNNRYNCFKFEGPNGGLDCDKAIPACGVCIRLVQDLN